MKIKKSVKEEKGLKEMFRERATAVLQEKFAYANIHSMPRLVKVTVHTGTGRIGKELHQTIIRSLTMITGQKPAPCPAKKSIASFGTREGSIIGFRCVLRGRRMYDFISRLVDIALPRTRDFRGIPEKSFDPNGNLSLGIREHTVFPEVALEDMRTTFGLQITVTSAAASREEAIAFLRAIGFPIQAQQ